MNDKAIEVKPTFDHEIIPIEKGGAMVFITDMNVEVNDPQRPDNPKSVFTRLKRYFK